MKAFAASPLAILLVCLMLAVSAGAQAGPPARDAQKEELIRQELRKTAPAAVDDFAAATAALDAKNYDEAIRRYNEVLKKAPDFDAALRRLGFALIGAGKRADGLAQTKKALGLRRTPENLLGSASALTDPGPNDYQPTASEFAQAYVFANEALEKDATGDPDYLLAATHYALFAERVEEFAAHAKALAARLPEHPAAHYYNGLRLANESDFGGAIKEIEAARAAGMPDEEAAPLLAALKKSKSEQYFGLGDYIAYGFYLVAAWLVGLAALFVAGKALSAKTLRAIETSDPNDETGGAQAGLRGVYRKLIAAAGVYYFISQPVVMLIVLVATAGVILFFFWIGTIPVKLVLVIGFVGLATVFYMLKSLFVRSAPEDPGRLLTEAEAPGLWELVRAVAADLGTRPVSEIRLTHGAEMAVYERGGVRERLADRGERVLIIGLATLGGFSRNAFRSVLAHEYGHFSNRDTAGGDIALHVNAHIMRLAESMAESGTATVYNIAFQFLRFYHFLFRRITHGASRLQEVLADRVAVCRYGAEAFREGLTHVIRRDIEFRHVAEGEINAAFSAGRALQNLYELTPPDAALGASLEQELNEYLSRATTEDDTHPSPQDRFRLIARITPRAPVAPLAGEMWDLFLDREGLTREMSALLERRLKAIAE